MMNPSPCVVLDPTNHIGPATGVDKRMAERPATLDGAVVGILANSPESAGLLKALGAEIAAGHGVSEVICLTKASISRPPTAEQMKVLLSRATVVLVGNGV